MSRSLIAIVFFLLSATTLPRHLYSQVQLRWKAPAYSVTRFDIIRTLQASDSSSPTLRLVGQLHMSAVPGSQAIDLRWIEDSVQQDRAAFDFKLPGTLDTAAVYVELERGGAVARAFPAATRASGRMDVDDDWNEAFPIQFPETPVVPGDRWPVISQGHWQHPFFGSVTSDTHASAVLDSLTTDSGKLLAWITVRGVSSNVSPNMMRSDSIVSRITWSVDEGLLEEIVTEEQSLFSTTALFAVPTKTPLKIEIRIRRRRDDFHP